MKKLVLLLFLFIPWLLQGQVLTPEAVVTSGDYYEGSSGSLSFSIGECVTETYSQTSGTLTQGFQQAEIVVVSSLSNPLAQVGLTAFPVPAGSILKLEMQTWQNGLSAVLYDMNGIEIMRKNLLSSITEFNLASLPAGGYILRVFEESGLFVQSFRITKL